MASQFESSVKEVAKEAQVLCHFFNQNGYYQPAFNQGGFNEWDELPGDIEVSRKKLQAAAKAVHDLAARPEAFYHDTSTLRWLLAFKIPDAVPLHGSITYAKLATTCNVNESHLRRMLKYAMTNHLFREVEPDEVAHTAYSAVLVTDQDLRTTLQYNTDELFPTSAKLVETHEKWMNRSEKNKTAFQVAWNTDLPMKEYLEQEGMEERLELYSKTQELLESSPGHDITHTITAYPWPQIRRLVSIGNALSPTAITLAREFSHLRIIVEDFPSSIEKAQASLPEDLERKIYFTAHDYTSTKPQPDEVSGADVYLLRDVLSHYDDEVAVRVLEGVVEVLLDGGKLVIMELVVPASDNLTLDGERELRAKDLDSMIMENGKLRGLGEWEALLCQVDEGLRIGAVRRVEGSALSVLEVVVEGREE